MNISVEFATDSPYNLIYVAKERSNEGKTLF